MVDELLLNQLHDLKTLSSDIFKLNIAKQLYIDVTEK